MNPTVFFQTTDLTPAELKHEEARAMSQNDLIMELFKITPKWTACRIEYASKRMPKLPTILFTSARRALTTLAKQGKLIKTKDQIKSPYGGLEHYYIINPNFKL